MFRTGKYLAVVLLLTSSLVSASAENTSPTPAPAQTTSKFKLTREMLKEWREKWSANRAKMIACRKEVKAKGLTGDDRWFYMEDCMGKT